MRQKFKLILCLFTAVSLIMTVLLSCSDSDAKLNSNNISAESTEISEGEMLDLNVPNISKTDLKGQSFRVIYPTHANYAYQHSEDATGDSLDDALYLRDTAVEDFLNIKTQYTVTDGIEGVYDNVKTSVMAGDNNYDLILSHCNWELTSYISGKFVLNWYDIPNIDLSKPYWNQNMNDSLAIQEILPVASSNYIIADPNILLFNTQLLSNNGLDTPYSLVEDGKWTWDKLTEMSSAVVQDLDGDGKMTVDDQYGIAVDVTGSSFKLRSIPASCNQYTYSRNENNMLVCSVNTPQMQSILEKVINIFKSESGYLLNYGKLENDAEGISHFNKGTTLFYLIDSLKAGGYRDTEFEYGILPLPKYNESQDKYYSLDWSGLMLVPATVTDTTFVGTVTELLSYYGKEIVKPVFFGTLMSEKIARNEKSSKMLDIIYANLVYDPAINYKSVGFYTFFDNLVMNKNSNLSSTYASKEEAENRYIGELNEIFTEFKAK